MKPPVLAVDIHTHLFPPRLMTAVRRALGDMYGWDFALPDDPETFAAFVREHGTERFCILPYAHKPGVAASLNAWVAETAASLDGAIGFACVNQDDVEPGRMLAAAFDAGLRGVKLHYQVQNVVPADPRLDPVYEFLLERDAPLIVHAGKGPTDNGLVGVDRFAELMRRFPELRVCVAHLGWPERERFVALVSDYPNLYLDTSGMGNQSFSGLGLETVADRILFGTDAPNIAFDYGLTISRITDLGLGKPAERMIFRENAMRFLALA